MTQQRTQLTGTLGEVAQACSGEVDAGWAEVSFRGVSTDTRELVPGELFVALAGPHYDGHNFLAEAARAGAVGAVISRREAAPEGLPVVVVRDTLMALGRLAALHRSRSSTRIVAITGSTGKTTTKEMVGGILALVGPTLVAEGTQNNEVGVPLTLLRLAPEHRFGVLELAMRAPGEIDYLARMVAPDVGVITNIGQSHVGRLGTREAIAQVKAELLGHIRGEGPAVLNADDFFFGVLAAMARGPVVSFGLSPQAQFRAEEIVEEGLKGVRFRLVTPVGERDVRLSVPGRHNVLNALAAAAAAAQLGVNIDNIAAGLAAHRGATMRMQRLPGRNGSIVISDTYNASPDSVAAALAVLAQTEGRRIFVFGDMLEMGAAGLPAHREVGEKAHAAGVTWLIAVGELAALASERAAELGVRVDRVRDAAAAAEVLGPELAPGDVVLVKGSRAIGLERVVEAITDGR